MNFINGQPDLNSATIQELKALAYDGIALIQNAQAELDRINQTIAQKSKQEQEEKIEKEQNGDTKKHNTK